jgi:hypothetical protein
MRGDETACPYLGVVDFVFVQDLVAQLLVYVGQGRSAVKGDATRLLSLEVNLQEMACAVGGNRELQADGWRCLTDSATSRDASGSPGMNPTLYQTSPYDDWSTLPHCCMRDESHGSVC